MAEFTDPDLQKLQAAIAKRRAAKAAREAKIRQHDDLVPETQYEQSHEDDDIDRILAKVDIVSAYNQWCGKMRPTSRPGQVESIMVSCPIPGHKDENPSAWLNSEKGTWFCARCDTGGDSFTLAAIRHGMNLDDYNKGANFHELRKLMARDLGYVITKPPGATSEIVYKPEPVVQPTPPELSVVPSPEPEPTAPAPAIVTAELDTPEVPDITPVLPDDDDFILTPGIDWRKLVPKDTFLYEYLRACSGDTAPEEFHFWNGMMALGLSVGRDAFMVDQPPVLGNLFVCLIGQSGTGKSKSLFPLKALLEAALPYDPASSTSRGTNFISAPGSGESLVHAFSKPVRDDPGAPKRITDWAPVRGMVEFPELSALTSRANRQGSVLKPHMMELYDGSPVVSTRSMTHGETRAYNPFACTVTTTQPDALKGLLRASDADSGFLNRWIFAPGIEKPQVTINRYTYDLSEAIKTLKTINVWTAMGKKPIEMSAKAEERLHQHNVDIIWPMKRDDKSDMLNRFDLLNKKLALLFTINNLETEVTVETIERVISMHNYLVDAYAIPAAKVGLGGEFNEIYHSFVKVAKERTVRTGQGPTRTDLMRYSNARRKGWNIDMIGRVIDLMAKNGEIEVISKDSGRGRPSIRYVYIGGE
jgi:hypothetical protein